MRLEISIPAQDAGRTVRDVLRAAGVSAALLRRAKAQGGIFLDGRPVFVTARVQAGDVLTLLCAEPAPAVPRETGPLRILFEDAWYLCLDKPAGQFTHPTPRVNSGTLLNFALGHLPPGSGCHAVSRLDRDTCGVILFAKDGHAQHRALGRMTKTYLARVYGHPAVPAGTIALPIRRQAPHALRRIVAPDGAAAVTDWRVADADAESSLLALTLHTGRTHQIRVHCLAIGHPVLGDALYNTPRSRALSCRLGIRTQALCAARLRFEHPFTGQSLCFESAFQKNIWKGS